MGNLEVLFGGNDIIFSEEFIATFEVINGFKRIDSFTMRSIPKSEAISTSRTLMHVGLKL